MVRKAGFLVVAFCVSAASDSFENTAVAYAAWHIFGFTAATIVWIGAIRSDPKVRAGWIAIACGVTAWVLGDVVWDVYDYWIGLPAVSFADALYVAGYAGLIIGIAMLTRSAVGQIPADALIDGAILGVSVGLVYWTAVVAPSAEANANTLLGITTAAYAIAPLVLVAAVGWSWFHPQRSALPRGLALLGLAAILVVALESLSGWYYLYAPAVDLEGAINRLFQLTYALFAIAPFGGRTIRDFNDSTGLHPIRHATLTAALMAGPLTMFFSPDSRSAAIVGATLISVLVVARFVRLSHARERTRSTLAHRANHDVLTGLPNRGLLIETLDNALVEGEQSLHGPALLAIDVDRFKSINDMYGHAAGDALLISISERLRESVRDSDVAARLGGDEFVVLFPSVDNQQTAVSVAERMLRRMADPFILGDGIVEDVTISIGLSFTNDDVPTLMRTADAALYEAKRAGRAQLCVYGENVPVSPLTG